MLRKLVFLLFVFLLTVSSVQAITSPTAVPNNRYGVHILDPDEVTEAAKLVNSSGGDWGYVIVPIRSDDRDTEKWYRFFTTAAQKHVIPIIRLTTYVDKDKWVMPSSYDLVDFANFLNQMPWPIKNRYIVLFNEPNHSKEWGGEVNPSYYATLLIEAHTIFKNRSQDFFLLSAGLDMSAPTNRTSLDALEFYKRMTAAQPDWYRFVDGLSVHPYPNPGFRSSPYSKSRYGITSYRRETSLLTSLGFPPKPIFITETGYLGHEDFFTPAFKEIWIEDNIVAVTPFVLFAGAGDFIGFSLLDLSHQPTVPYKTLFNLPKIPGSPLLANPIPRPQVVRISSPPTSPTPSSSSKYNRPDLLTRIRNLFSRPSQSLTIDSTSLTVDIADSAVSRARGLSGRPPLPNDHGMLFIFPQPGIHSFWMKDMQFALDFIWIRSGQVVQLDQNIPPPGQTNNQPQVLIPSVDIDQVLEVNAGFIKDHEIKIGDPVIKN